MQFGLELPPFENVESARLALLARRDTGLRELQGLAELDGVLDYSPESLKTLEKWYFDSSQPSTTATGYPIANAIAFYLGEVFCRHAGFDWVVEEYAFVKGRYEIGVRRSRMTLMLGGGRTPSLNKNKQRRSLLREFEKYSRR
jgi:hypothetical protein